MADTFNIQLRNDTAANWTTYNPLLLQGEAGLETDTSKIKIGDGVTVWTVLPYWVQPSAAQVNSDWNAISGLAQILNKPTALSSKFKYFSGQQISIFNYNGGFSGSVILGLDNIYAFPFRVFDDISIASINITSVTNTGGYVRFAIYADNGANYPGALVWQQPVGSPISVATAGINTYTLSPAQALTNNTKYWLRVVSNATSNIKGGTSGMAPTPHNANGIGVLQTSSGNYIYTCFKIVSSGSFGINYPSTMPAGGTKIDATVSTSAPIIIVA